MIKLFKKREDPRITTTYKVYHFRDYDYSNLEKFLKIECNLSGSAINTIKQEINSSVIKLEYIIYQGGNIFLRDRSSFYKEFKCISGFKKSDRSSFSYWFAHWCAFQLCALNLKKWKFKYLFHDIEKPWIKLFRSYDVVQKWHRDHNKHHLEYGLINGWDKVDWEALIIDWECSRLTKIDAQLDAYETIELELSNKWKDYAVYIEPYLYGKLREFYL